MVQLFDSCWKDGFNSVSLILKGVNSSNQFFFFLKKDVQFFESLLKKRLNSLSRFFQKKFDSVGHIQKKVRFCESRRYETRRCGYSRHTRCIQIIQHYKTIVYYMWPRYYYTEAKAETQTHWSNILCTNSKLLCVACNKRQNKELVCQLSTVPLCRIRQEDKSHHQELGWYPLHCETNSLVVKVNKLIHLEIVGEIWACPSPFQRQAPLIRVQQVTDWACPSSFQRQAPLCRVRQETDHILNIRQQRVYSNPLSGPAHLSCPARGRPHHQKTSVTQFSSPL